MALFSTSLSNLGFHFSTYGEDGELNSNRILGEDRIQEDFECNECQFNSHYYYCNFDKDDYCKELVSKFNTYFADELKEILGVLSVQFTGYVSPREYNFHDDEWNLTIRYKGKGNRNSEIESQFKEVLTNLVNKEDYKIFDTNCFSELFKMCYSDFVDYSHLEWFLTEGITYSSVDEEMVNSLLNLNLSKELFHTLYPTHSIEEIAKAYDIDEDVVYHIDLVTKIVTNWSKEIEEKSLLLNF